MMEEKQKKGLTEEEKRVIREMIERHYGVKLGPDTPEDEVRMKELRRLWNEQARRLRESKKTEQDTTPTE